MSARPRILLIKPVLPYPPNQGTKIVSFELIRALQSEFDVTVLARIQSPEEEALARELEVHCERVVTVLAPNRKSILHRVAYKGFYQAKSMLMRRSLKSQYDCPGTFIRAARELAKEDFDLVFVDYWQLYRMLPLFPPERCVLVTHDIDLLVNRQVSLLERNLMRKIQAVRRWILEQREEIEAYRTAGHVWALTEQDKLAVESIRRDGSVDILPFGVDTDYFSPSGMQRNNGEILFLGHLKAPFNHDALTYFVQRIHPHLDDIEGHSITVLGGGLPRELEYFGLQRDVEVVGRVPDIRPYLHRASCLVVPLRFGGGLRIRILEAMSAGLPIVCSKVAIAGMPFEEGKEYLLAEAPEDYAAQVRRLLEDEQLATSISLAALERVRNLYGAVHQRHRMVELVRGLVQNGRETG